MRSVKTAKLIFEKFGVHPFTFSQTEVQLPHADSWGLQCLSGTWWTALTNTSDRYEHCLSKKYYFRDVTLMLWGKVDVGLWIVFPFSRITEQNLKPHIRIKYKFSDEVANEKGNSFVLADYVFTFNTMQWPNCAVDLTLFKVIWYWSAFRCNATAIKPIKCNATQIWFFRHIISVRNHHIAEKASRLAKAYLLFLVSFSTFWYICIEFYF